MRGCRNESDRIVASNRTIYLCFRGTRLACSVWDIISNNFTNRISASRNIKIRFLRYCRAAQDDEMFTLSC